MDVDGADESRRVGRGGMPPVPLESERVAVDRRVATVSTVERVVSARTSLIVALVAVFVVVFVVVDAGLMLLAVVTVTLASGEVSRTVLVSVVSAAVTVVVVGVGVVVVGVLVAAAHTFLGQFIRWPPGSSATNSGLRHQPVHVLSTPPTVFQQNLASENPSTALTAKYFGHGAVAAAVVAAVVVNTSQHAPSAHQSSPLCSGCSLNAVTLSVHSLPTAKTSPAPHSWKGPTAESTTQKTRNASTHDVPVRSNTSGASGCARRTKL